MRTDVALMTPMAVACGCTANDNRVVNRVVTRSVVAGFLAIAGCTGSTTVNVELAFDPPDFIAYRDGASAWKTPKPVMGGTYAAHHYDLEVTGDYELVAVWIESNSGKPTSTELHATEGDGTHWYLDGGGAYAIDGVVLEPPYPSFCWVPNLPLNLSGSVIASGTMTQPGQISIGGWCTSSNKASWSYQLSVLPGVHDIIATDPLGSASPRVAISRGVTIDAAMTLPNIDLGNGQRLDATTITVVNTGTEANDAVPITSQVKLFTATEGAALASVTDVQATSRSHVVPIVPASVLETSDSQVLTISVTDYSNAHRWATTRHPTETPFFELLSSPVLAYTTDTGVDTATWSEPLSSRVEAVDVHTWLMDAPSSITAETITATARWLTAHHATSLGYDRDIPGFDPSWPVDVTAPHTTTFTVRGNEGHIGYATTQSQPN